MEDLQQEGFIALVIAMREYRPNPEYSFKKYSARKIKDAITTAVYAKGQIVTMGKYQLETVSSLQSVLEQKADELQRALTGKEIKEVFEKVAGIQGIQALTEAVGLSDGGLLDLEALDSGTDVINDDSSLEEQLTRIETEEILLSTIFKALSERERNIVLANAVFGMTFESIAEGFEPSVTRSRCWQIYERALKKLRHQIWWDRRIESKM